LEAGDTMRSTAEMQRDLTIQTETGTRTVAAAELRSRKHTLNLPTTAIGRAALSAQNVLEAFVARASVLPDVPIYDAADFAWLAAVEAEWQSVRAELDQVMLHRDRMPSFHEIIKEVSSISADDTWKTFFLIGVGMDCSGNAARCPQTMRLLARIPGVTTAFFSILSPGKHIPAHRGAYNGVLRLHLPLVVPEPRERCRIRIGDQFHVWQEGEGLVFDDTYNHEVWNDTDGWRVVLFVDFARPLRQPWHWLNRKLIGLGPLAPFLREAGRKQKAWETTFYKKG
jgi:beta-hydroxylase